MGNSCSYTSLTQLPSDNWNNPRYTELGITLSEPKKKENGDHCVLTSAQFPNGWTIKCEGDYHTKYYDPEGYLRFTTSYKNTDYDCWAHVNFTSQEQSERIRNEDLEKEKLQNEKKLFFSTLPQTLDTTNQYVVFEYTEADMYDLRRGGHEDHKDEFDRRKLLFTTNSVETAKSIIQDIYTQKYSNKNIAIRHAPNGFGNLTRFEIRQLFGEEHDPCLVVRNYGGTSMKVYENSHNPNRTTYYKLVTCVN